MKKSNETATEKVLRLLSSYPKNQWEQKELASAAGCSRAFASKLVKKLQGMGIVARISRNKLILISLPKLLSYWVSVRKMPEPVYFKINDYSTALKRIKKLKAYCLTLFSAAYIRTGLIKTNRIELYFYGDFKEIRNFFGKPSVVPAGLVMFPSDKDVAIGSEILDGIRLVGLCQNYADLMSSSGTGVRAAVALDRKYNLMGV